MVMGSYDRGHSWWKFKPRAVRGVVIAVKAVIAVFHLCR